MSYAHISSNDVNLISTARKSTARNRTNKINREIMLICVKYKTGHGRLIHSSKAFKREKAAIGVLWGL